jgi:hypothetical protein
VGQYCTTSRKEQSQEIASCGMTEPEMQSDFRDKLMLIGATVSGFRDGDLIAKSTRTRVSDGGVRWATREKKEPERFNKANKRAHAPFVENAITRAVEENVMVACAAPENVGPQTPKRRPGHNQVVIGSETAATPDLSSPPPSTKIPKPSAMDGLVAALNQPPPPFAVDSSTQNFMLSMMGRYMGLGASRETKAPEIPKVQYASLVDVLTTANVTPERLETILATLTSNCGRFCAVRVDGLGGAQVFHHTRSGGSDACIRFCALKDFLTASARSAWAHSHSHRPQPATATATG